MRFLSHKKLLPWEMIDVTDRPRPTGRTAADIVATLGIVLTAAVRRRKRRGEVAGVHGPRRTEWPTGRRARQKTTACRRNARSRGSLFPAKKGGAEAGIGKIPAPPKGRASVFDVTSRHPLHDGRIAVREELTRRGVEQADFPHVLVVQFEAEDVEVFAHALGTDGLGNHHGA